MEENSSHLEDVIVKSPPVYENKDTLNYDVSAFTSAKDRVIADVIKKLPGVEIKADGKIYYNGQEIQRYLVEGLNLMENQYGLLNENLPVDAVRKVQIIEHDQPIRLMDSLRFSNKPALNLKLKKYLTTGVAKIGAGAKPFLWNIDLTPIVLKRELQMLNSFQSNNIGVDLSNKIQNNAEANYGAGLIAIEGLTTPDFEKTRWLSNQSNFISSNILKKIGPNVEVRGSISFLNNFEIQSGSSKSLFFLPNKQISLIEQASNHYNNNTLHAAFKIERNDKRHYWQDKFDIGKKWNSDLGLLQTGAGQNQGIKQRYRTNYLNLSNHFNTVIPRKKQLLQFRSMINYYDLPQSLKVFPGQFDTLINEGNPYQIVMQDFDMHVFNTKNVISLTKGMGAFSISPELGFEADQQALVSKLSNPLENKDKEQSALENNSRYSKWAGFGGISAQIKKENWRLDIQVPIQYQTITLDDRLTPDKSVLNKTTFDPSAEATINLNEYSDISYSLNVNHEFGNLTRLYTGFLMKSYRNLQRMTNMIPISVIWRNGLRWDFKYPLHQLFFGIGYNMMSIKNNLIYSATIASNGSSQSAAILQDNNTTRSVIAINADKYILPIKSSIKTSASYSYSSSQILLNEIFTDILNKRLDLSLQLDIFVAKPLNITYMGSYSLIKTRQAKGKATSFTQEGHHLAFNIFPAKNHMISVKGDYYANDISDNKNQMFLDVNYRYSFGKKKKYDISLMLNNLLNTKQYQSLQNNGYITIENSFQIRPRQALLQLSFNF